MTAEPSDGDDTADHTAEAADTADADTAAPGRRSRRSLAVALLLGVLGAALVLLSVGRTWAEGRVPADQAQQSALAVSASGREVTGVPAALALVGLAALVAVFAVRRVGRVAVSALLLLSGAGVILASVLGAVDEDPLDEAAAAAAGLTGVAAADVSHTAWPWAAALGGLLMLLAGLTALVRGRYWPGMSARYDAPGTAGRPARRSAPPADQDRPDEMWKALDRGEDPTDR